MSEPVKIYGNVDLRALRGAQLIHNEDDVECIQIPIDIANLRRSGSHIYLPIFAFEKKIHNFDFLITRSQTKEEREARQRSEILGNAIFVKNKPKTGGNSSTSASGNSNTGGDNPF